MQDQDPNSIFDVFQKATQIPANVRAENAFNVAVKFFELLEETIENDHIRELLIKAWIRAIKDKDFNKFKKIWKKYN